MADAADTAVWTAAIASGDTAAFERFYAAWFDATLALARAVGRRDEDFGLDVVQEVMMRVVDRMPPLRTEAAVAAWLSRTVRSVAIDRLRRDARRQRREARAAADRADRHERAERAAADVGDLHARGEQRAWLEAQLAALPALDRQLVEARFGGVAAVAALGREHGLGANRTHGRLRRALERLRRAARDWVGGEWIDG